MGGTKALGLLQHQLKVPIEVKSKNHLLGGYLLFQWAQIRYRFFLKVFLLWLLCRS
jgi:hypothetical protein